MYNFNHRYISLLSLCLLFCWIRASTTAWISDYDLLRPGHYCLLVLISGQFDFSFARPWIFLFTGSRPLDCLITLLPCGLINHCFKYFLWSALGSVRPHLTVLLFDGSNTYFMLKYDNKFIKIYMMLLFWICL